MMENAFPKRKRAVRLVKGRMLRDKPLAPEPPYGGLRPIQRFKRPDGDIPANKVVPRNNAFRLCKKAERFFCGRRRSTFYV